MGAVEHAVDAAANFVGPFLDKTPQHTPPRQDGPPNVDEIVNEALLHLQAINIADLASEPDAPYDASLAGVVYGLLDIITLFGIVPCLSQGVMFSQRPKSVLSAYASLPSYKNEQTLSKTLQRLLPILEQLGSGVQPLLSQRILPDIISALAELSYSPISTKETQSKFSSVYQRIVADVSTSRLLLILTTFLQQPLPSWLKPVIATDLALIPLRPNGIRHTIEFLSLSYLSKNSHVPKDASSSQSQILIPLEAVTQASRLLVLPPNGVSQNDWLLKLAPQLFELLDGNDGRELSRAAGQIIAGGILSKRATGSPGMVGWELFARPLLQSIYPKDIMHTKRHNGIDVIVQESHLRLALKRISIITMSYSHGGLIRRLIGPLLLPLWALLNHAKSRPSLDKEWARLAQSILSRYMAIACDAKQVDSIALNLFWDGDSSWIFGPGSRGGIEIRRRTQEQSGAADMDNIISHIGELDSQINLIVSLLAEANVPDGVVASLFLQATKRWLSPEQTLEKSLIDESDVKFLSTLTDAKLSEALATKFNGSFARSPQHIIELMGQLLQNFVKEHKSKARELAKASAPSRASLGHIAERTDVTQGKAEPEAADEDLLSFALSITHTLVASPDYKSTPEITAITTSFLPSLAYLSQHQGQPTISATIVSSATNVLSFFNRSLSNNLLPTTTTSDPLAEHRATLKSILSDLTSPSPPNRTWALSMLRKLIQNPTTFPVIDVPSLTHALLSASLADPEPYVHTVAILVMGDLAIRSSNLVVDILADAFADIDEQAFELGRKTQTEERQKELQHVLDYRLRIGEVLNNLVADTVFSGSHSENPLRYRHVNAILKACLSLASRRGKRNKTLSVRTQLAQAEKELQQEGEAAWDGPIPNLLEGESENPADQAEHDALVKLIQGWENTGTEEDMRIRASALSVLSAILEHRLPLLRQPTVHASVQLVLMTLTLETAEAQAILRRSGVLVIMGFLRGLDAALENGDEGVVGLSLEQQGEVERIIRWMRDEDNDALVRDHAASVLEGLETLGMKRLYKLRDESVRLGPSLGLEGSLRGLNVKLDPERVGRKRIVVEELE